MLRLLSVVASTCEPFSTGKNYFMDTNYVTNDLGEIQGVYGNDLFCYTNRTSFYMYTQEEVEQLIETLEDEMDGIPSVEQTSRMEKLVAIVDDMGNK